MKKRLEADLISIAHRILQIKDKSDVNQLYLETQKLYEKLSVLKFIEENYADAQPSIGNYSQIEKEIEKLYDNVTTPIIENKAEVETKAAVNEEIIDIKEVIQEVAIEQTPEALTEEIIEVEEVIQEIATEQTPEAVIEEIQEEEVEELITEEEAIVEETNIEFHEEEPEIIVEEAKIEEEKIAETLEIPKFKAAFQLDQETTIENSKKAEAIQISFEDLLGMSYNEPEFVKVDDTIAPVKNIVFETVETVIKEEKTETPVEKAIETTEKAPKKAISLNDKFSKGIDIDLNDRIAFVKHLFGNSNEDYNRVMNQLITYDNFFETKSFIDEMVKPDYNYWKGKEEYEERFMELIEKKFL